MSRILGARLAPCLSASVVVIAGVLAGCGSTSTGGSNKVLHLYTISPLTGSSAFVGKGTLKEEQLLAGVINKAGGFTDSCGNKHTIKLTVWDDGGAPAQAVTGMHRAAGDPSVLGVLGSSSDTTWLPELPVAGQEKLPMIIPSDGTTVPKNKWNPYAFRVLGSAVTTFKISMGILSKAVQFHRVGVMYESNEAANAQDASLWKTYAPTFGYKIVAYQSFTGSDTDFRSQLTAIKNANPDFIVIDGAEPSGVYKQAAQLGLLPRIPLYSAYGVTATEQEWGLSNGVVNHSYFFTPGAPTLGLKMNDPRAVNLYQKATGTLPYIWHVYGWDALNLAVNAVKKSCSTTDREKFRDALAQTTNFPLAVTGRVTWRNPPTGENLTPSSLVGQVTGKGTYKVFGLAKG